MNKLKYEELKKISKKVKKIFAKKGIIIKKTIRRKPRDKEKKKLIYLKTINRLKKYKPISIDGKIFFPYFKS